jgi:hypothetical protein
MRARLSLEPYVAVRGERGRFDDELAWSSIEDDAVSLGNLQAVFHENRRISTQSVDKTHVPRKMATYPFAGILQLA